MMNPKAQAILDTLKAKIATMTTKQIVLSVKMIGGGNVNEEQRAVRYFLINEFEEREGEQKADELMAAVGMA